MQKANKVQIDLTGPPQTLLATLYAKALDADARHPILADKIAKDLVDRIDYDWGKTTVTPRTASLVTIRSAQLDKWVSSFLAAHEQAVVLHIGCGLDSRAFRLRLKSGVVWYDVDYPDVIALREKLYPSRENYYLLPASVTESEWLTAIPPDRDVLLIAEGLTMYLPQADGLALFRRVVERFPSGELQFDVFNRFAIRTQLINRAIRRTGSTMRWGVNSPEEIVRAVPGVRLLCAVPLLDAETTRELAHLNRIAGKMMSRVPVLGTMQQIHRYAF